MERTSRREGWSRWAPAVALSALLVAVAPFAGELRAALAALFGRGFRFAVTAALVLAAAAILGLAFHRLRAAGASAPFPPSRRLGALALAAGLVALEVAFWTTGDRSSDAVERVHLLEYALLAVLYDRALRPRHRAFSRLVLTLEAVAFVGLADETVQWLTPVRVGDGRDVLLNLYAGLVGVVLLWGLAPAAVAAPPAGRRPDRRRAALLGALLVVAAGAFFDGVHLGHEIDDPELGVFRSSFAAPELVRAGAGARPALGRRPSRAVPAAGPRGRLPHRGRRARPEA